MPVQLCKLTFEIFSCFVKLWEWETQIFSNPSKTKNNLLWSFKSWPWQNFSLRTVGQFRLTLNFLHRNCFRTVLFTFKLLKATIHIYTPKSLFFKRFSVQTIACVQAKCKKQFCNTTRWRAFKYVKYCKNWRSFLEGRR